MLGNTPLPPASIAGVPQALDELRTVEVKLDPATRSAREWEIQARQHEYQESLLQHVREILDSEQHLHAETLALLRGMDDPRATEVLIEAALRGDEDRQARAQAVEILSRHAADLDYRDEASVNALKQLADDSDSLAAEVARQALEQYAQHSAAP